MRIRLTALASILALLVVLGGQAMAAETQGPRASVPPLALAQTSLTTFFLKTTPVNNTSGSTVVVDSRGGVHVAFSAETTVNNTRPAYYGYCPSNCSSYSSWTIIPVGQLGPHGNTTALALDPSGHPRMMWVYENFNAPYTYYYAECNSGCTSAGSWHRVAVVSPNLDPDDNHFFALESGRPRFWYKDTATGHTGSYYTYCDSACTSQDNWWEVGFSSAMYYNPQLVFNSAGNPRFAFIDSQGYLVYIECDANCDTNTNKAAVLGSVGTGRWFSLQLDSQDRPRLAVYSGYITGATTNATLSYLWCNSDCAFWESPVPKNWVRQSVGLPQEYGAGVSLALDSQGKPRLAYFVDATSESGLGYSVCTANCETTAPTWQSQIIETPEELNASDPVPPKPGCGSSWVDVGKYPWLALTGTGDPVITFDTVHAQGSPCSYQEDVKLVRLAVPVGGTGGGGNGGGSIHLYLPLLLR